MSKISVIVPVYNVECYLKRSIESLQRQTLKDIEIILVNDGSTDRSLNVCLEYQKHDKRIRVIDKPNGGVSSARNAGLEIANSKYIGFVDPDDWVEPRMYESLLRRIEETQADVCMCNYVVESRWGRSIPVQLPVQQVLLDNCKDINYHIVSNMLASPTLHGSTTIMGSVWRLLVRRELLEINCIRFPEDVALMEDLVFCIETLKCCARLSVEPGFHYHYFVRSNSAVRQYRKDMSVTVDRVFQLLRDILTDELAEYPILRERMALRYVSDRLSLLANEMRKGNEKKVWERIERIRSLCKDPKLKAITRKMDTKSYSIRKQFLIGALRREWWLSLALYYLIVSRVIHR